MYWKINGNKQMKNIVLLALAMLILACQAPKKRMRFLLMKLFRQKKTLKFLNRKL